MIDRRWWTVGAAVALAAVLIGCGDDDGDTTTSPTPSPSATITITAAGVSPREVTVAPGGRVAFVNNDSRQHEMASDPHPEHTACPEVTVGVIAPGQSRTTQNLNSVRSCGFHDHVNPGVASLQGVIRIQ